METMGTVYEEEISKSFLASFWYQIASCYSLKLITFSQGKKAPQGFPA